MAYQHGIRVQEVETSMITPVEGIAGLQVVFGTAPVNLVENPPVNEPIIAHSYEEAVAQLGYSENFAAYTLCQSMYASFQMFGVAPVIFINVLDPAKHKKANEETTVSVSNMQATVPILGILKSTVSITANESPLTEGEDYTLSFDEEGYLVITLVADGAGEAAETLKVTSTSIDPTAVTATDVVGGYDASSGAETGLEVIRKVYPKFGMTPGLLLAPGWSQDPDVGVVMATKCEEINGVFSCECLLDLDSSSTGADQYTKCADLKNTCGYINKHAVVLWPEVKVGSKQLKYSAVFGALVAYTDAQNDDVPNLYASNKAMAIAGTVLEDGTEVMLDQVQANVLNGQGIVTAINVGGWRAWGNNMACYPENQDPKDRWFGCRRFFTWWGNSFILTYFQKVDDPANYRLIESIVDSENIRGNSYTAQGKCAGARMEYLAAENPIEDILDGKIQFHMYLAPYTPAEDILCTLEFDPSMLETALGGE